jgi:hypothetical protein
MVGIGAHTILLGNICPDGKCSQDKQRKLKMPLAFLALSGAIPTRSTKNTHDKHGYL